MEKKNNTTTLESLEIHELIETIDENNKKQSFVNDMLEFMDEEEIKELDIDLEKDIIIKSKEQANFFIKQIKNIRKEIDDINDLAKSELERQKRLINSWKESRTNTLKGKEEYLTAALQIYVDEECKDKDKKSINLPYGILAYRKASSKFEYEEDEIIAETLKNVKKELINYKPIINKTELKKVGKIKNGHFYINGTLIKGIKVIPQDSKFEVRLNNNQKSSIENK